MMKRKTSADNGRASENDSDPEKLQTPGDGESVSSCDPSPEPTVEKPQVIDPPYSVFTPAQKRLIVFFGSMGALFSPMSTTIYLPALNTLAADLHVSNADINLTITTFLVRSNCANAGSKSRCFFLRKLTSSAQILQGIAPTFVAGFSDTAGRRPAYIACLIIYIAANIGLALQRNYAALMVLRCLQSAGSSGTVALSYGLTADVVTSAERGVYVGFASVPVIAGPILGPIIGGLISQYLGWEWIFWFLTILSGLYFVFYLLFFPETCRKVVGDGSLYPPLINRDITSIMRERRRRRKGIPVNERMQAEVAKTYRLSMPNPFSTLSIIADRSSAIILVCGGLVVACLYAINTGIPSQFHDIYNFNDLQIGLVFIAFGDGSVVSAFTTGKLIDWNWRRTCRLHGFPLDKNHHQDLTNFPLEKARLQICLPLLYFAGICIITFGWVLHFRTSLAGPLIMLFLIGYGVIAAFQILQILMVDLNPGKAAASTAANNLFRCLLGAASTSVIMPMIDAMGVGWTYTFAAVVWMTISGALIYLIKVGPRWRIAKREKVERKERERDGTNERRDDEAPADNEDREDKSMNKDTIGGGDTQITPGDTMSGKRGKESAVDGITE